MPRPKNLQDFEIILKGGYHPSAPALAPEELQQTIRRGSNIWMRPGGKIETAKGISQVSSQNVGARIFGVDIVRVTVDGGLTSSRLPYVGFLRHDNGCYFFTGENTSSQVYFNESSVSGMTTASSAGLLRVSIPTGGGAFTTTNAGFDKPVLPSANVAIATSVDTNRNMNGRIGVALAPWRTKTNANGPPSHPVYTNPTAGSGSVIRVTLPSPVSGQDGWIYCGTRWNDQGGELRVVRYIYLTVRGTFTATNGSANITAGVNTKFTQDLYRSDQLTIDGANYNILTVTSDSTCTINPVFGGVTGSGKTATVNIVDGSWVDQELGDIVSKNVQRPPRCAGVLKYSGRVFVWGCLSAASTDPTGPVIFPTIQDNPEHVPILGLSTASGSDLVNVLGGDGPLYLMTTTSLEVVSFTGDPSRPFNIRIVAYPGFVAATNGVLVTDAFYGYNGRPIRTRARENVDTEFAAPVWSDMTGWNPVRVMVAYDPKNQAVLYAYDDGAATIVIPFMVQQEQWSAPINLAARAIDWAVVSGELYLTYLSGGNYRVNKWEGGAGVSGYGSTQYLDPHLMTRDRLKILEATGKIQTLRVYAALPDTTVPDVSSSGAATASFTLSDVDKVEPMIKTNIAGAAFAFRVDLNTDGSFQKLIAGGLPRGER